MVFHTFLPEKNGIYFEFRNTAEPSRWYQPCFSPWTLNYALMFFADYIHT